MAQYKSSSVSQPRNEYKQNCADKADKMLGKGMNNNKRIRSHTNPDCLDTPFENKSSISPGSSQTDIFTASMSKTGNIHVDYISQLTKIKSDIEKKIDRLIDILQGRRSELIEEVDELIAEHVKSESAFDEEQKKIEGLIEQASSLGQSNELRDQITRSGQLSLCKHALTSSIRRDAKFEIQDFCNELASFGKISVSDYPNYTMRNQCYSFPVKHGKGEKDIGLGAGVSVTDQGVYIVDSENNRVQVYSLEGNHSVQMKNLPKMNWPFGICVVGELVYVTQQQSHTLCMYSTSGELLSHAGGKGTGTDKLMKPSGLDVFESDVFVCDQENHRVQVFDARKLSHRRKMSIPSFNHPTDCHVAGSELLVLTMSDPCMHAFSLDGKHLRQLISWGPGKEVTTSIFFTVDKFGNIIVSEIGTNCLKVFDQSGFLLSKITCDGAIHQPSGVGLDSEGQIYLAHKSQRGMVMMC